MAWQEQEAYKVAARLDRLEKTHAIFQCGFGPSGLPHIGTIAEMIRTTQVRHALHTKYQGKYTSELILFVDDLDPLRKVPGNIDPAYRSQMDSSLGRVVSNVSNPWMDSIGTDETLAGQAIKEVIRMLAEVGLYQEEHYIMRRSSTVYRKGVFDDILKEAVKNIDDIKKVITYDYGDERKETYCPILPIQNGQIVTDLYDWTFAMNGRKPFLAYYTKPAGVPRERQICYFLSGGSKAQWKLDWALRWMTYDVDYEMHGKDLLGSAQVGDRICRLMGKEPPVHMMYELFLDGDGKKMSKSTGNTGITNIWLQYAPMDSLWFFLGQNPRKARELTWNVIPNTVDLWLKEYPKESPVTYSMLLNLVGVINPVSDTELLMYLRQYAPDATYEKYPNLKSMIAGAMNYYKKQIVPHKTYREPTEEEVVVLQQLSEAFSEFSNDWQAGVDIENSIRVAGYDIGKKTYGVDRLKEYFAMIYQVLLGQETGPQLNKLIMVVGPDAFSALVAKRTNS